MRIASLYARLSGSLKPVALSPAASRSRRARLGRETALVGALAVLTLASPALAQNSIALPTDGAFVRGEGQIGQPSPNALAITQSTQRGVIDWRTFSIATGKQVAIDNGSGATLNRVMGGQISQINGLLSATGSVYLMNPHGVIVGTGGQVISGGNFVASIMATPLERDDRGYERQFATNVLGHYQLTVRLLPALERAKGARVINVASRGHHAGGVLFDDINFNHTPYTGMRAYAQSKTALILLSIKEDALWRDKQIRVFATTPGPVPTSDLFAAGGVGHKPSRQVALGRLAAATLRALHVTEALNLRRRPKNEGDLYKTVQQGGATATWAAVSRDLDGKGGVYLEDCDIAPVVPDEGRAPYGVKSWALDVSVADQLWSLCETMTGVRVPTNGA